MLDEEMYVRKRLVRIRCMRNTMHVLPRDLIPAAFASTREVTSCPTPGDSLNTAA